MLRIREYDDLGNKIDLKVLEKFGFKYDKITDSYTNDDGTIDVRTENRHILIIFDFASELPLYDLIKADLVEKVDD